MSFYFGVGRSFRLGCVESFYDQFYWLMVTTIMIDSNFQSASVRKPGIFRIASLKSLSKRAPAARHYLPRRDLKMRILFQSLESSHRELD